MLRIFVEGMNVFRAVKNIYRITPFIEKRGLELIYASLLFMFLPPDVKFFSCHTMVSF